MCGKWAVVTVLGVLLMDRIRKRKVNNDDRFRTAVLAVVMLYAFAAHATGYTWDVVPSNGVIDDGSGVWDGVAPNWTLDGGAANGVWPNSTNDVALFSGITGGAVLVDGTLSVGGISFLGTNGASYVLSATNNALMAIGADGLVVEGQDVAPRFDHSLNLSLLTSQVWTNDSSAMLSVQSDVVAAATLTLIISGSGDAHVAGDLKDGTNVLGLVKEGVGVLTLSGGGNAYGGSTIVNAGTLVVTNGTVTTLDLREGSIHLDRPARALGVTVTGGQLILNGEVVNTLKVTRGSVSNEVGAVVGIADFGSGLGTVNADNPFMITNSLVFDEKIRVTLGGGAPFFTLSGEDVMAPTPDHHRLISSYGGTLTIGGVSYPTNGLLGLWNFDRGTADDASGNGRHGVAVNDPEYRSSNVGSGGGKCLVLNGSNYIQVDTGGIQTVFDGREGITVSAWVVSWPSRHGSFVSKYGDGGEGWRIGRLNNWGNMSWLTRGTTNDVGALNENLYQGTFYQLDFSRAAWRLFTVTYDGQTKKTYHNGVLDAEVACSGPITDTKALLIIGGRSDAAETIGVGHWGTFNGTLDDVYIYDRAITSNEVMQIYDYIPDLTWTNTDLAVSGTNQYFLPAGVTSFGRLTLRDSGTELALSRTGAITASFERIVAENDSAISGPQAVAVRSGRIDVYTNTVLSLNTPMVDAPLDRGLVKVGAGTLTLSAMNTYAADTYVTEGTLRITQPYLSDTSSVHLTTGATLELDFASSDTVWSLTIDGQKQTYGKWAAVGSLAAHNRESPLITGAGVLNVLQGPYMVFIVR
jgi:autotransporter-associated beta strand protein